MGKTELPTVTPMERLENELERTGAPILIQDRLGCGDDPVVKLAQDVGKPNPEYLCHIQASEAAWLLGRFPWHALAADGGDDRPITMGKVAVKHVVRAVFGAYEQGRTRGES